MAQQRAPSSRRRRRSPRQSANANARRRCARPARSAKRRSNSTSPPSAPRGRAWRRACGDRAQQLRGRPDRRAGADDGVISARSATVGAVLPAGQEAVPHDQERPHRMARRGRSSDLASTAWHEGDARAAERRRGHRHGRMVAPTVDAQTRNGIRSTSTWRRRAALAPACSRAAKFDIGPRPRRRCRRPRCCCATVSDT